MRAANEREPSLLTLLVVLLAAAAAIGATVAVIGPELVDGADSTFEGIDDNRVDDRLDRSVASSGDEEPGAEYEEPETGDDRDSPEASSAVDRGAPEESSSSDRDGPPADRPGNGEGPPDDVGPPGHAGPPNEEGDEGGD